MLDPTHIVVGVQPGPAIWTRVASVSEGGGTVTVGVRSLRLLLPESAGSDLVELAITLGQPLDQKRVVDGLDGSSPQRLKCAPTTVCQ